MTEMDKLINKRGQLKAQLSRFEKFINTVEEDNFDQLKIRFQKIENTIDIFDEVQAEIEYLSGEIDEEDLERETFENKYFSLVTKAKRLLKQSVKKSSSSSNKSSASAAATPSVNHIDSPILVTNDNNTVKLPKISLPEFSGNYEDFRSFKETFNSLIDNRPDLDQIKKFLYLRSCLKKDAFQVIEELETAADSYQIAWDLLNKRFENKKLGHMEEIDSSQSTDKFNFLPHHCVCNDNSSTTKIRAVFHASCKTSSDLSFNNILMVGPTIQEDLVSIVLRFRRHQYVMTADITKMYRQVNLVPEHRNLQCIVWRENQDEPIKEYRLNTVTYGTAPASYLATRCLQELAILNKDHYHVGALATRRDFYMDDLMCGSDNLEEALMMQQEVIEILSQGKFELHKWCANNPALFEPIPPDKIEVKYILNVDNATNFIGTIRELKKSIKQALKDPQISEYTSNEGITWNFIPPRAPNFGGLWESSITSMKYHLKRVVGNALLTFEEMSTYLAMIEACLNSRPLIPLSTDPNDFSTLTPGHFLIGDSLTAIIEPDLTTYKANALSRWRRIQQLSQHFWRRSIKESAFI
ncbi:hypothetical protein O3M35_005360 [Rhynocoris fuscipes]|uniref:Reverse transcriptase domain-containing protein n=1 Tax=Rhynocoris fuscipes TaxID=488301 RepID=A0AAW1DQI5_9HEMI